MGKLPGYVYCRKTKTCENSKQNGLLMVKILVSKYAAVLCTTGLNGRPIIITTVLKLPCRSSE